MWKPTFNEKIYFNRDKEDNWDLCDKAKELGFSKESIRKLKYLGYEIEFEVNISEKNGELIVDIVKAPESL